MLPLLAACNNASEDLASEDGESVDEIKEICEGSIQVPDQPLSLIMEFENDGGILSILLQG